MLTEGWQRRGRYHVDRQAVPDGGFGDREGPAADGRQFHGGTSRRLVRAERRERNLAINKQNKTSRPIVTAASVGCKHGTARICCWEPRRGPVLPTRGVDLKKKWGTLETRLRQRLNNLGLHTRTLVHVGKIATADLWSCPAIQLLVFKCL